MLRLHIKKKHIIRLVIALVIFLPAAIFAGKELIKTNDSLALGATLSLKFHGNGTWTDVPETRYCTFDEYENGCSMTLPDQIPSREKYHFLGWATERDGWPEYWPGDVVWIDTDEDLYAVWTPIRTVSFVLNGGEGDYPALSCYVDPFLEDGDWTNVTLESTKTGSSSDEDARWPSCYVNLPEEEPTRDGYIFVGWSQYNIGFNDEDEPKENERRISIDEYEEKFMSEYGPIEHAHAGGGKFWMGCERKTYTLYAVWVPAITLEFDLNGGEGEVPVQSCTILNYEKVYYEETDMYYYKYRSFDETCDVRIPRDEPTREDYTFLGWADKNTAKTPEYYSNDTVTLDDKKTVYAVWAPSYTLSYDMNGGSGEVAVKTCTFETAEPATCDLEITSVVPVRENYYFLGWGNAAGDDRASYRAGDTITLDGSKVLYAIWTPIYTISLDANGGLGATDVLSCHSEIVVNGACDITIPETKPVKEGNYFLGWGKSASATAATYYPGDIITFGGVQENADVPMRSMIAVRATTVADENESMMLYAVWSPICALVFDVNGGTGYIEAQGCNSTTSSTDPCDVTIPTTEPTRTGYKFLGWATTKKATAAEYDPGDTLSLTENKVLYAVWEATMPVPDTGDDTPTPKPDTKPSPSIPDTGRVTDDELRSSIISNIIIIVTTTSVLAMSAYMIKRHSDKKKMEFSENR